MSLQKARDSLGSLRSQHKSIKNCSCKNLKGSSLHHLHLHQHHLRQQLVDTILGKREKEQQVQIHQYPYQVHNMLFLAQVGKIHQFLNQIQIEKKSTPQCNSKTKGGNSPIPVQLDSVPPGMRALQLQFKKDGTLPRNPTDYFNFVVDTCWRANTPVLTSSFRI